MEALRPYFDVDTADVLVRMKGSLRYCLVDDGFRNEVLYSDNALRLAYRNTNHEEGGNGNAGGGDDDGAAGVGGEDGHPGANAAATTTTTGGKGPDLYGPVWITLTLVFFVAVTSNMSLYLHHRHAAKSILEKGGAAAAEEWDYDINQLLHATWILYSFSLGLPTVLYFALSLLGAGALGHADLVCLYGYSLVPYLPAAWLCAAASGGLQWLVLAAATVPSALLVLRNVTRPILEGAGGASGAGFLGALRGKGAGPILFVVGCHVVFLLVLKLGFYHHA